MRTPTENGFGSSRKPASCSSSNTSRAEWPQATTTCRAGNVSRAPVRTFSTSMDATRPPTRRTPQKRAWKRTSPPRAMISSRSVATTRGSRSLPICGCACHRISSGAPRVREQAQDVLRVGVLRVRGELSVGERARTAFAELHVRIRVEHAARLEGRHILGALVHAAAAFQHKWTEPGARQIERREQPRRACAHDDRTNEVSVCRNFGAIRNSERSIGFVQFHVRGHRARTAGVPCTFACARTLLDRAR